MIEFEQRIEKLEEKFEVDEQEKLEYKLRIQSILRPPEVHIRILMSTRGLHGAYGG